MSRIGKLHITVPAGVEVKISDTNEITVKGPSEDKMHKSLHGLTRTLVNNMVIGVTEGFTKELEINGVGYRAAMQGKTLNLSLGYSHPVLYEAKEGANKEDVGATAAKIREYRQPEPYKGKGIKYVDEHIRRKEGKTGAKKK